MSAIAPFRGQLKARKTDSAKQSTRLDSRTSHSAIPGSDAIRQLQLTPLEDPYTLRIGDRAYSMTHAWMPATFCCEAEDYVLDHDELFKPLRTQPSSDDPVAKLVLTCPYIHVLECPIMNDCVAAVLDVIRSAKNWIFVTPADAWYHSRRYADVPNLISAVASDCMGIEPSQLKAIGA